MRYTVKFKELQDRDWLQKQYVDFQKSATAIAKEIGCHKTSVSIALKNFGIKTRSNSEAQKIKEHKSFMYQQLNDAAWLREKYEKEKLSTNKISEIVGCNRNSVRQSLIRHGIDVRNLSEGATTNRENDFVANLEVLNGCLLGDGTLKRNDRFSSMSNASFRKRNIHEDHVRYVASFLSKNPNSRVKLCHERFRGKDIDIWSFSTLSQKILTKYDEMWYPEWNFHKKIVPKNLKITPTVLLHWFLDDGYSGIRKDRKKTCPFVYFCSESFTKEDNLFLVQQINDLFGLDAAISKTNGGTGYRIRILQNKTELFYNIIGPPPFSSLAYKWKECTKCKRTA